MLIYLIIVLLFCAIYPLVPRKHIKWLFIALVLALSIMAFFAVPKDTDDLYNYFRTLAKLRRGGFKCLRRMIENGEEHWDSLPVCGFYFYLISLFPDNGMLPAVTIFLAYGSMFWVLWRASQRYEVNKWYLFVASFFILSTYWFYDICSGIRNGLTFTLFCFFAYVELVEKKWRPACWVGYVAMCLMHSSGILMMMIRIALLLSGKKNSKFMSVLVFFALILGGAVMPRLGEITNIEYLKLISEKAESHGDKRLCKRNTVSCKCICVRGCRMRLLLCGLCYQKTDGKVRKLFGLYKFCSADSLFHAGFNYFHSDLYPLCPLGDSRGHFGSLYGRYAGKLKRKN